MQALNTKQSTCKQTGGRVSNVSLILVPIIDSMMPRKYLAADIAAKKHEIASNKFQPLTGAGETS